MLALLPFALLVLGGNLQINPSKRVAELEAERNTRVSQTLKEGKGDIAAIDQDIAAKAAADLKDHNPEAVPANQFTAWAKLYHLARKFEQERYLLLRFLKTWPTGQTDFDAKMAYLLASVELNKGDDIHRMYNQVKAPNPQSGSTFASYMGGTFHHYIRDAAGPQAAISALDYAVKQVPFPPFASDELRKSAGWARRQHIDAKASYLVELGKPTEAIKLIDEGMKTLDPDIFRRAELLDARNRYALIGKPIPHLPAINKIGDYSSLTDLKGKVVVLDFTAHWCHACIKSLPSLRRLYDARKKDGLELLGVTTYYGHFGAENSKNRDMPRAEEFGRMPKWMEDQGINWPMVYVDRPTMKAFGIAGIPQVMLIDRKGILRMIDLGFSDAKFKRFEEQVAKYLAEAP